MGFGSAPIVPHQVSHSQTFLHHVVIRVYYCVSISGRFEALFAAVEGVVDARRNEGETAARGRKARQAPQILKRLQEEMDNKYRQTEVKSSVIFEYSYKSA